MRYLSDLTSKGLLPYKKDIESHKVRHIVLLDLVRLLAHARNVSERTIQALAALMEEGESETSDAGGTESWGQDFPKAGVLMAITPSFFHSKRGRWRDTGFLTRFVPIAFEYSESTVHLIHMAIANGHHLPMPHPENVPANDVQIFCPPNYSLTLARRSEILGDRMKTYGFRYQRVLRALAKAQARIESRGAVNDADVVKVLSWSEFFTETPVTL